MDPASYLDFSMDWAELVSIPSYIKALMVEIFLILGDSFDVNVRFNLATKDIIHFDYKFALTEGNAFQGDESLSSMFQTCLLLLPQAYRTLAQEDIACMQFWMRHLARIFPAALAYFSSRYAKTMAQVDPEAPDEQANIERVWHQRVAVMRHMLALVEQGKITTLADFTLGCFPAYKTIVYAKNRLCRP